jgi:hypothetical protein
MGVNRCPGLLIANLLASIALLRVTLHLIGLPCPRDTKSMPLSDLTDPSAISAAMHEFNRVGREKFLQKYGFGPSRMYFLLHDGKYYDSKAIVGAAYGYQFPQNGPLHSDDFSGGDSTVRALLERLGFSVEERGPDEAGMFTNHDIELIRQSRSRDRYTDFSDEEREAHKRVHETLRRLGEMAVRELGGTRDYVLKLTSGFHPASGIRGGKPKDLWFGVYRKECLTSAPSGQNGVVS